MRTVDRGHVIVRPDESPEIIYAAPRVQRGSRSPIGRPNVTVSSVATAM
jgi:hypothetical protein